MAGGAPRRAPSAPRRAPSAAPGARQAAPTGHWPGPSNGRAPIANHPRPRHIAPDHLGDKYACSRALAGEPKVARVLARGSTLPWGRAGRRIQLRMYVNNGPQPERP